MTEATPEARQIARAAARAFGTAPTFERYWDEDEAQNVDLVTCRDSPWEGVTSHATIGVSKAPLVKDGRRLRVRTEFVGACASASSDVFQQCLATAGFCVLNSGWFAAPGVVFPDVLAMYSASSTMKHLLFLPPFLWDDQLRSMTFEGWQLGWLMAVPISERELQVAQNEGVPALEDRFEAHQIDVFDLERASVE